jgi:DNA replication and repair protein RecF
LKIKNLKLTNFRNWEDKVFSFNDKVLIYGPNARGKTNILESIYLAATTRSFRGHDAEMVSENKDFMKLEVLFEKDKEVDIEIFFNKSDRVEKEFKIMGNKRPTIDFVGEFSAIIFSPEDLNLVSGTPADKRRYLSFTIGQKDRQYLYDLLNYKKILRQRNELLRRADLGIIKEEIDIWDRSLAEYGQRVIDKRNKLEDFINERINKYYYKLSSDERLIKFCYQPSTKEESLIKGLQQARGRDLNERTTTVGPHRDSWELYVDNCLAEGYASRGEYRTLILALKLCERDYFIERDGVAPVILLDDVFSELDENRRKYLVEAFSDSQLIITTTDLDHLDESFKNAFQLIDVENLQPKLDISLD